MIPQFRNLNEVRLKAEQSTSARSKSAAALSDRCMKFGANSLTLSECLSLILDSKIKRQKTGRIAEKLMQRVAPGMNDAEQARAFFMLLDSASQAPTPETNLLMPPNEARMLAVFELARRYHFFVESAQKPRFPVGVSDQTREMLSRVAETWRNLSVEWLGFVPICNGRAGNLCIAAKGVRTHVNVDPVELFARIFSLRPEAIFLLHNHPSGNLTPSHDDYEITRRVDDLCKKFGIRLLSHWIVSGPREVEIIL